MELVSGSIIDDSGVAYRIASHEGGPHWEDYRRGLWHKTDEVPALVIQRAANLDSVRSGHIRIPELGAADIVDGY